jgi:diguanylate cyclase (GGDEF)-like protein/PAS domain S-box-containing protein
MAVSGGSTERISDADFRVLAERSGDEFYVLRVRPDLAFEYVSDSALRVVGFTPEQHYADASVIAARLDPQDARRITDFVTSGVDRPADTIVRWSHPDGRTVWLEHRGFVRNGPDGTVVLEGSLRDVTDVHDARRDMEVSERLFRSLAESAGDIVLREAPDGRMEYVSPSVTHILGWTPEEFAQMRPTEIWHADDLDALRRARADLADALAGTVRGRARAVCRDGSYRWLEVSGRVVVDGDGATLFAVSVARDVHDGMLMEQALATSEERFRLAMAEAPNGMAIVGLDRTLQDVNPALCDILGYPADELIGRSLGTLLVGSDALADLADREALVDGTAEAVTAQRRFSRANGAEALVEHAMSLVRDADGRAQYFVSQFQDVTELHAAISALSELAARDRLTGLFNRGELIDRLHDRLAHQRRAGKGVAALYCDVDNLKMVNDEFGHRVGDELLRQIGARLAAAVRTTDLVARIGGDEFVVVLDGVRDLADAERLATAIHTAVRTDLHVGDAVLQPGLSIGIAMAEDDQSVDDMLSNADVALYSAKRAGRNRVASYGSGTLLPPE